MPVNGSSVGIRLFATVVLLWGRALLETPNRVHGEVDVNVVKTWGG